VHLVLHVFGELLAVFLLFELLPVPVNLDVSLVGSDNLVLNLVRPLLFLLVLRDTAFVLDFVRVRADLSDLGIRLLLQLLKNACTV